MTGPRTNDLEIKKKYEETVNMDKALKKLKDVIYNFSHCFEEIMKYNKEINEYIFLLYEDNEEYKEFAFVMGEVHEDNNKLFGQITQDLAALNEKIKGWPTYFSKNKELFDEKEKSRKTYDHYETKLENLIVEKDLKIKKGFNQSDSFIRKLERNEEKFLKAKERYLKNCNNSYNTYETLLNERFNLINPPLLNLFYIELKVYENFSSKYKTYKNIEEKLSKMKNNFAQKDAKLKYDPSMFLKNPYIESKFSSPNIGDSQKISKEDIKSLNKSHDHVHYNPTTVIRSDNPSKNVNCFYESNEDFNRIANQFSDLSNNKNKHNSFCQGNVEQNKNDVFFNFSDFNFDLNNKNKNNNFSNSKANPGTQPELNCILKDIILNSGNENASSSSNTSGNENPIEEKIIFDNDKKGVFINTSENPFFKTEENNNFNFKNVNANHNNFKYKNEIDDNDKSSRISYPSLSSVLNQTECHINKRDINTELNHPHQQIQLLSPPKKKLLELEDLLNNDSLLKIPQTNNNPITSRKLESPFEGFY